MLAFSFSLKAQQLPLYTQYMLNGFQFNPAMAGYDGYTSFNLVARRQWISFPGAPNTYSFNAQTRLLKQTHRIIALPTGKNRFREGSQGKVGLGANFFNDVNGKVSRTGVQFSYAYHIFMYRSQLSFGLAGQFYQYRIGDSLSYAQAGDPLFASGISRVAFIPDANAGVASDSQTLFSDGRLPVYQRSKWI